MNTRLFRTGALLAFALSTACGAMLAPAARGAATSTHIVRASGSLTDFSASTADPTDGASARFVSVGVDGQGTRSVLVVTGLDPSSVGKTYGAHVHTGPCTPGAPADAGPHYNIGAAPSAQSEVWLDFTVRPGGVGVSVSSVPFVIPAGGAGSVVIHALPTDSGGVAGARMACLPVAF